MNTYYALGLAKNFETSRSLWIQCYLKKKISSSLVFSQGGTLFSKSSHDLPMLLTLGENRYLLWVHSAQASSLSAWDPSSHENETKRRTRLEQASLFLARSPASDQILFSLCGPVRSDSASFYGKVYVSCQYWCSRFHHHTQSTIFIHRVNREI